VVGVGNIYACEALFRAKIHPLRPAQEVHEKEAELLAASIKQVLREAIASGGSTLRDYVRSSGDTGYFQHHFSVYGRAGKPCVVCENPIQSIRQGGRSTFFCAHCQRHPALAHNGHMHSKGKLAVAPRAAKRRSKLPTQRIKK
jgi:formamidopyrimidine-DNA glycosylase